MSKIALIAKLTAADGKSVDVEAALRAVTAAAAEEPGLEIYAAHGCEAEPGVYYFYEVYADAEAYAVHGKGDGMRAAMGGFAGLLASRPQITLLTPISAKGLSFD